MIITILSIKVWPWPLFFTWIHSYMFSNTLIWGQICFRFLGGSIAEYISDLIETGVANEAIIADHFSYDRWRAKYINIHKSEPATKVKIIQSIRELVHRIVDTFVWKLDLEDMFDNRRRQFIQLKKFAEKRNGGLIKASREMAQILKKFVTRYFLLHCYISASVK